MDNEQTELTDEEFIATLKRLQSHAETRTDQAFKSGDRKQFEVWDHRVSRLKAVTSIDELRELQARMERQ